MTKQVAHRIKPLPTSTPQCEGAFPSEKDTYTPLYLARRVERAENKGWDVDRCLRHSAYVVRGEALCSNHAAKEALDYLLGGEDEQG